MSNTCGPGRIDLPTNDVERYHAAILELADEARRVAAPLLRRGFATEMKTDASPVTEVDCTIERRLRELIAGRFPDHGVIGEEYPPHQPDSAFQWILDPIDGTEELIHGIPTWGAMLALDYAGVPVVGLIDHPALDVRASAGVGLGAWCNGQRIRLRSPESSTRPEAGRLVMTARLNFIRGIDEGQIFDALPTGRMLSAVFGRRDVVEQLVRLF